MHTTTSRITIHARAQQVWAALTDPVKVKRWQYGSDLVTTWQPGTPIRFVTPWGDQVFEQWGTVLEFEPPVRLKYSLFAPRPDLADRPENYFRMTYQLEESAGETTLSIIHDDPRPRAAEAGDDDGGNAVLEALKALVERGG